MPPLNTVLAELTPTAVYDSYWHFAAERQAIFFRRLRGEAAPYTTDLVLRDFKFTNAYRASDRVSQYLIREVIYRAEYDPAATVFRILLFKLFNKIETWQLLEQTFGELAPDTFDYSAATQLLADAQERGERIYSPAYIMPPGQCGGRKHDAHLHLLRMVMAPQALRRVLDATSLQNLFEVLRGFPMVGRFLAFQYAIDLNYSTLFDFSEDDFVVAGPGALDGLHKCFRSLHGRTPEDVIRIIADHQEAEFAHRGLHFESLCTRRLHLVDCQNLFCEVSKYARVAHPEAAAQSGRTRIKQRFRLREDEISYWYPPKWRINDCIGAIQRRHAEGSLKS